MGCFISGRDGSYYEGDRVHVLDIEVPKRPNPWSTWDKDAAAWIVGQDPAALAAAVAGTEQRNRDDALAKLDAHVSGAKQIPQDEFNALVVQLLKGGS